MLETSLCVCTKTYILIVPAQYIFVPAIDYLFRSSSLLQCLRSTYIPITWQCIGHYSFNHFFPVSFTFSCAPSRFATKKSVLNITSDGWCCCCRRRRCNNNETHIRFTTLFYDVGVYRMSRKPMSIYHFMVYRLLLLLLFLDTFFQVSNRIQSLCGW